MTDFFDLMGLERRPWLEEEVVKGQFLELSASAHPDKVEATERLAAEGVFSELNRAHQTLKNPRERLLHLLALEGVPTGGHVQNVPPAAMELFSEVGQLLRQCDTFIATKSKATSPMMKAQLFTTGLDWTDKLQNLSANIHARIVGLQDEIKAVDARWSGSKKDERAALGHQLEQITRALGFLERWRAQLQERIHALAF